MTVPAIPTPGAPVPAPGAPQATADAFGGVNWGDLMKSSGGANEPLPKGEYDVQIVKAEATKTSNQKTMFKCTLNVVAGPHTNRRLWWNAVVSPENPQALGIFFSQMAGLGLTQAYFANNPTPDQVAQDLQDKYARVVVDIRPYQGTPRNDVKSVKQAVIQGSGQGAVPSYSPTPQPQAAPAPVQQAAPPVAQPAPIPQPAPQPMPEPAAPAAPAPAPAAPVQAPAPQAEQPAQPPAPAPVVEPPAPAPAPVQEAPVAAPVQQEAPPTPVAPPAPAQSSTPAPPPIVF